MTYKLPHPLDRPGQPEALNWILNSNKKYNILCAPTGFGKSPLAAACSINYKIMALVLHKSLQSANYKDQYDFDILYGKNNYPCLEKNKTLQLAMFDTPKFTAYDCGNPHCECPYQLQESCCIESQRVSLNYAKFLMSKSFTEQFEPQFLFLDEAHNLPDIVCNFVGLALDWNNEFLQTNGKIKPSFERRLNYEEAMMLFRQCARVIEYNKPDQEENLKKWRKWKRLRQKVASTNHILNTGLLNDWYYETDNKQLIVKPLTAKYHFKHLFGAANKVVLMSATITPNIAERLGLGEDEFDFHQVENIWPTPSRLVYDLNAPVMNWKSGEDDKYKQADLILSLLDENKSGIIHVSSKSQAYELSDRLNQLSEDAQSYCDFWFPEGNMGTDEQLEEWCRSRQPGTYCISWNFHEGVDLGKDDINIMAKTPWTSLKSNYEKAKLKYDPDWYNEKTGYTMMQLFGRHQRGLLKHYAPGAKMAYIADSSWHRLKPSLPNDFIRRIRNWNGK